MVSWFEAVFWQQGLGNIYDLINIKMLKGSKKFARRIISQHPKVVFFSGRNIKYLFKKYIYCTSIYYENKQKLLKGQKATKIYLLTIFQVHRKSMKLYSIQNGWKAVLKCKSTLESRQAVVVQHFRYIFF